MTNAKIPAGYLIVCSACGVPMPAGTAFAREQLKKKHPRCRSCAPNKFSNRREGGHQSKLEGGRAKLLRSAAAGGAIRNYAEQVPFELIPAQRDASGKIIERACSYIADFVYDDDLGHHVEDAKGMRTDVYKLKRKLMLWVHGIRIEEVHA